MGARAPGLWGMALLAVILVLFCPATSGLPTSLSEAVQQAGNLAFNPLTDCNLTDLYYASFLGPQQTVRTGDVLQAYRRFGQLPCPAGAAAPAGPQPPIMLIPGYGYTSAFWGVPFLEGLACGREVVTLENRGAGASVDYSATNLTYFTMAEAVLELADALNITRPDIFGHSMGGGVAMTLAALYGDQVGRVVVLSGGVNYNATATNDSPSVAAGLDKLNPAQQAALIYPLDAGFEASACGFVQEMVSLPDGLQVTSGVNASVKAAQQAAGAAFRRDPTVWEALPNVTNPLLFITGAQDMIVPPATTLRTAARVPLAWLAQFPSWGHRWRDAPQLLAVVKAFLGARGLWEERN